MYGFSNDRDTNSTPAPRHLLRFLSPICTVQVLADHDNSHRCSSVFSGLVKHLSGCRRREAGALVDTDGIATSRRCINVGLVMVNHEVCRPSARFFPCDVRSSAKLPEDVPRNGTPKLTNRRKNCNNENEGQTAFVPASELQCFCLVTLADIHLEVVCEENHMALGDKAVSLPLFS